MSKQIRKKPSDYPQISFRVSQQEKDEILEQIEQITEMLNKRRDPDIKVIRGNAVVVNALKIGLAELRRRKDF